jgi:hypothetical protein
MHEFDVDIDPFFEVAAIIARSRSIRLARQAFNLLHRAQINTLREGVRGDPGDSSVEVPVVAHEVLAISGVPTHCIDDIVKVGGICRRAMDRGIDVDEFFERIAHGNRIGDARGIADNRQKSVTQAHDGSLFRDEKPTATTQPDIHGSAFGEQSGGFTDRGPAEASLLAKLVHRGNAITW